jgi:hypothetical protein
MSGNAVMLTLLRELDEITVADRIRQVTDLRVQEKIDGEMIARVARYGDASRSSLTMRLAELEEEWDIERVLVLQSSATALTGLALAAGGHRRWLLLSAVTTGFLLQHALQGWCPPLVLHRRLGFRTRAEIDLEIHMLKLLRGDFGQLSAPLPSAAPAASPADS